MKTKIKRNIARIIAPHLLNNKKWLLLATGMLALFLVIINIFVVNKKQDIPSLKKDDMTIFLENLMIREGGLYTLLGSKPITEFCIMGTIAETEEEIRKTYDDILDFYKMSLIDSENFKWKGRPLPEYDVYRKVYLTDPESMRFHNKKKLWNAWALEKGASISNQIYKLTSRGKKRKVGHFINIPNAIYILKKYYSDFAGITGITFDADTILNSIDERDSPFWKKVFRNAYLTGLLYGYGEKNACLFDWMRKNSLSHGSVSINRFEELSRLNDNGYLMQKADITVEDLPIPYFVTFEIADENVERYAKEREKIVNFLKDKDLISFVLNQLS